MCVLLRIQSENRSEHDVTGWMHGCLSMERFMQYVINE